LCLVDFWAGNTKWTYKMDSLGGIPSWLDIWGLINDAKLFQNLGHCLLLIILGLSVFYMLLF
jgi:hypothetical protein